MSTPSTAVAALPQQYGQFQAPFSHHHNHYPASPSTKDAPSPSLASASKRFLPYLPQAAAASPADGLTTTTTTAAQHHQQPSPAPPIPPPHLYIEPSTTSNYNYHHHESHPSAPTNPGESLSSTMTSTTMTALDQSQSRKRRRSREPDWGTFYRNGLPKEIIVIDDSPEPEANTSRKLAATSHTHAALASDASAGQPARKRRREDDAAARASGYHVQYLHSQHDNTTPHHNTTPLGSTLSSDRHNSSLNTTAPTSLSSAGAHEDGPAPLKRKRTRQAVAEDAKRRDIDGLGDPFMTYLPPPYPPKKAGDVAVRVVHDVRNDSPPAPSPCGRRQSAKCANQSQKNRPPNTKQASCDDEDGHYVIVPDADLTERCTYLLWRFAAG